MELSSPIAVITTITFLLLFPLKIFTQVKKSENGAQRLPPGPWKLPLVGNMHHLAGSTSPPRALANLAKKYGPLMHLQLGEISTVIVSSPQLAKEVLKTHDLAFANRPKLLATTIVAYNNTDIAASPHGAYWRQMRKICTMELFSARKVRSFSSIRDDEVRHLIESIRTSLGSPVNLTEKIFSMTYAITCRTAFGNVFKYRDTFVALSQKFLSLAGGFDAADLFPSLKLLHKLMGMRPKLVKIHKKMDEILDNIINEHRERLESRGGEACDTKEEDLVDVLLRIKDSGELDYPITSDNVKAVLLTSTHVCLITDFCPGGELFALLDNQPLKYFKEESARFYAAEVIIGLEYLHFLGIIYRDLKPENILLQKDGHVVLTDFDLSFRTSCKPQIVKHSLPKTRRRSRSQPPPMLIAEPFTQSNSFVGTEEYIAPEIITGASHTSAIDWWAVGILLYEMLYGRTPFRGKNRQKTFANILHKDLTFPSSIPVSLAGRQLIHALLNRDPATRLGSNGGANAIKEHPFFREINWPLIRCMTPPPLDAPLQFIGKEPNSKDVHWEDGVLAADPVDLF